MHGEQTRGDKEQRDSRCQSQNKESRFSGPSAFLPLSFKDLPVFRVSAGLRLRDTAGSLSKLLRLLSLKPLAQLPRILILSKLILMTRNLFLVQTTLPQMAKMKLPLWKMIPTTTKFMMMKA